MGRKEQQQKVEGMAMLIENVRSQLRLCSDCLGELEWAGHVDRLDKLQQASVKLNEKLSTAAPFAVEPTPGFNDMCEKLRGYVIKEYIVVARLTHKKFLSFLAGLEAYEAEVKAAGYRFDIDSAKQKLAEMTQAFRRLGSKKYHSTLKFVFRSGDVWWMDFLRPLFWPRRRVAAPERAAGAAPL